MSEAQTLDALRIQRTQAAANLANLDHAIASLEALDQSHMVDASCPHCNFVVTQDGGFEAHLRDVHPNPLVFPGATQQ
jgi:hypothetical protein